MLLKRPKENTKYVSAAGEKLTAAKHKLKLLELKLFRDAIAAAHMKLKKYSKRTKSDQNRTKTGSMAKPGKVRSSYSR
nr:hypothetical protein [Tanacetum cinerariifolium]